MSEAQVYNKAINIEFLDNIDIAHFHYQMSNLSQTLNLNSYF